MSRVLWRVVVISCGALFSCKPKQPPPVLPVPVNLYTVEAQRVSYYDKYPSTTAALSQVTLLPQVQGYITGIFFTEGSYVKKGDKLYEIDRRLYEAAYGTAAANLKVAQGTMLQAQQDADRYVYLNKYNAVAKQQYDHALITLQNAQNQVKSSEEAVKTAKTNLSYAIIYAPFNGTIGFSQVKLGNMVSVGQTILNTISTNDPMAVDFLINEKQLSAFSQLEKNSATPQDSLFTMLLPDNSGYPYTGKISVIDRAVDPQTGAIRVRLVFPNPQNTLKAGMSCVVRVHNRDTAPQLVIPGKAVTEQMGEYFVFVAKDTVLTDSTLKKPATPQRGLYAFQKKVIPGQTIGAQVIIKSGIDDGDHIVVDGVQLIHDGAQITTGNQHGHNNDSTGNTRKKRP
jgi:RND family efflux transporter MFP subunit